MTAEIRKGWEQAQTIQQSAPMEHEYELKVLAHYIRPSNSNSKEHGAGTGTGTAISYEAVYDRAYFDGDSSVGYRKPGYRNFPSNYSFAYEIFGMNPVPASVLELGGGRGYISRLLDAMGIKATCLDISKHCYMTRACSHFVLADATKMLPFENGEFDLLFSKDFLEHISETEIPALIKEMARVSLRGYHAITFSTHRTAHEDPAHRTLKPEAWWREQFRTFAPDYHVMIVDKETIEQKDHTIAISRLQTDDLVKLNIGSYMDCFHYGWENWDIIDLGDWCKHRGLRFRQVDVTNPLPVPDGTVDIIHSSHMLEHLTRAEGAAFLKECERVMKDGGMIRIGIPDARKICRSYLDGRIMDYAAFNVSVENSKDSAEALYELLLAGHKTCYDADSLSCMLREAGFVEVEQIEFSMSKSKIIESQVQDMYPEITTWVEGLVRKGDTSVSMGKTLAGAQSTPINDLRNYLDGTIKEGVLNAHKP